MTSIPEPKELKLNFPSWRDGQIKAIEWLESEDWLNDIQKDERDIKALEAPTGTGKTGIILALAKLNPDLRFLILCATKLEQEQYGKNLTSSEGVISIKGMNNYHCMIKHPSVEEEIVNGSGEDVECSDNQCWMVHVDEAPCRVEGKGKFDCPQKAICPYFADRARARQEQSVVTNYSMGLSMLNYTEGLLGEFDVIVEDEGHVLDEMLENFIAVKLSRRVVKRIFQIDLPRFSEGGDIPRWASWVRDWENEIAAIANSYQEVDPSLMTKSELRDALTAQRYADAFSRVEGMDYEWVVEETNRGENYEFKPVWVTDDSEKVLFEHAPRHIIMSGTIPSSIELGAKVGLTNADFSFFRLPYTFPPENRQIILKPSVSLKSSDLHANLPVLVDKVDEVLEENLFKKILIHAKTYEIAQYIVEASDYSDYMMTHRSQDRIVVLEEFKAAEAPCILVSPSFDKAVDLPGDECELIIIVKVPYPYLGSKVMSQRAKKNRKYYIHETLMTIIQMAGRGVRSEVDVCPTIILDKLGPTFFKQARKMIPAGIKEAIVEDK